MATKTKSKSKSKTTTKVKPLNEHVLVRPAQAESTTKGGIILPDTAKEKPAQGTVVALGEGKLLEDGTRAKFQVAVGNEVIYSKYAGHELTIDGEEFKVIQESDVYAIID